MQISTKLNSASQLWRCVQGFGGVTHNPCPATDIRTVQELLGHSDVSPTMIYTHVLKVAASGTASPLDALSSLM